MRNPLRGLLSLLLEPAKRIFKCLFRHFKCFYYTKGWEAKTRYELVARRTVRKQVAIFDGPTRCSTATTRGAESSVTEKAAASVF